MIAKQALCGGFAIVLLVGVATDATFAGDYPPAYDGAQASADALARSQARQVRDVQRQIGTIDYLEWYNQARWFGLESAYGYGYTRGPLYPRTVFEPWPYVPGDIWGFPWYDRAPQPIGRREVQTGPNRWESHPVYAPAPESPVGGTATSPIPRRIIEEPVPEDPVRELPKPVGPRPTARAF